MRREQLEHVLRAACSIVAGDTALVHAWYEGHLFAVDGPVDPAVFTAPSG